MEAKIVIEGDKTLVYFDDFPIASACVPGQEISMIKIEMTYQDLETKYFKDQSSASRYKIPVKIGRASCRERV